jgi:Fis family transcriptional regulator
MNHDHLKIHNGVLNAHARLVLEASMPLAEAESLFRHAVLCHAMRLAKGNQCQAAKLLGMHRNTIGRSLAELEIPKAARHWREPAAEKKTVLGIGAVASVKTA